MSHEHELKVDDRYIDKLGEHVAGMIADLHKGLGMADSKDSVIGHPALAAKVDAFEKSWHDDAKPNLIDHLQSLQKHIEKTRADVEALEKKLHAAADTKHQPTPTHTTPGQQPPPPGGHNPDGGNGGDGGKNGDGGKGGHRAGGPDDLGGGGGHLNQNRNVLPDGTPIDQPPTSHSTDTDNSDPGQPRDRGWNDETGYHPG